VHKAQGASVDATVALIDRSASAEVLFVAISRSKRALDVVVPRTAFRNLDDMVEHVAQHISLKTTTHNYDEVLQRTGGRQTIRVRNIEAQREAAPVRRLYDSEIVDPIRLIQAQRVDRAREDYRRAREDIARSTLSIERKLESHRQVLRSMRTAIIAAYREAQPQPFAEWLREREDQRDRIRVERGRVRRPDLRIDRTQEQLRYLSHGPFSRAETMTEESTQRIER
jgi:hypothetical protein